MDQNRHGDRIWSKFMKPFLSYYSSEVYWYMFDAGGFDRKIIHTTFSRVMSLCHLSLGLPCILS